jgi:hypothetical protein
MIDAHRRKDSGGDKGPEREEDDGEEEAAEDAEGTAPGEERQEGA